LPRLAFLLTVCLLPGIAALTAWFSGEGGDAARKAAAGACSHSQKTLQRAALGLFPLIQG